MSNNESPRTRGRNIIRGEDGKILYDSDNDKSNKNKTINTIYSGDGKRILYEHNK